MKLPDDRTTALRHLADYLESVRTGRDRAYREHTVKETDCVRHLHNAAAGDGCPMCVEGRKKNPPELLGFWQTPEWCTGLQELALECRRLAEQKPAILARRIVAFQNVHLPTNDKSGPEGATILSLVAFANDGSAWSVHAVPGGVEYVRIPDLPQP